MKSFERLAGIHASKADDLTFFPEYEREHIERAADALESIAHSLIALTLIQTVEWDNNSGVYDEFRSGWNDQS